MAIKPTRALDECNEDHLPETKHSHASRDLMDHELGQRRPSGVPAPAVNAPSPPLVSLSDVHRSLRRQEYQRRRCSQAQLSLSRLQMNSARAARLVVAARSIQQTLAECIRSEDKHSFVNLLDAFHESLDGCLQLSRSPVPETQPENTDTDQLTTFLDDLAPESREATLDFISNVRCDATYVADCLASLTHKKLIALLPDPTSRTGDSVLNHLSDSKIRLSRNLGYVVDAHVDHLLSGNLRSHLETLVHSVRSPSTGPRSEDARALQVWSTVCARLIADQKPGSEKVVPAVLDIWTTASEWPGKARLELWLSQTLQKAFFLVDQPSKQSFRMRISGRPEPSAEDQARSDAFYTEAVASLLELLGDPTGAPVVPGGVLDMCEATWCKLQDHPGYQRAFPQFVVTRWLFSTFVFGALTLPEAHGLLIDHHIPEAARHRVLREIASRAQKVVFDVIYSWFVSRYLQGVAFRANEHRRHGTSTSAEATARVQAVLRQFGGSRHTTDSMAAFRGGTDDSYTGSDPCTITMRAVDVYIMISALHPQRRSDSVTSGLDAPRSGLHSSSSSISGFSLFKNPGHTDGLAGLSVNEQDMDWPTSMTSGQRSDLLSTSLSEDTCASLLEPVLLWDACSSLDELLSVHGARGSEHWVTLISSRQDGKLETFAHALSKVGDDSAPISSLIVASDYASSIERLLASEFGSSFATSKGSQDPVNADHRIYSDLLQAFENRVSHCEDRNDFIGAHTWSQELLDVQSHVGNGSHLQIMLASIQCQAERATTRDGLSITTCEDWLAVIDPALDRTVAKLLTLDDGISRLRDKMWFVGDVRISAPYDEARSVTNALRIMGKPKRQLRNRMAPPLRHWSGQKLSSTNIHLKSEAQVLELLSISPDHGGPNKLSDDQARITAAWMQQNNVENLCRGEERLHRFCMEIRKCVDKLISNDSAALHTSLLFARDSLREKNAATKAAHGPLATLADTTGRYGHLSLQTNVGASIDAISSASHPLSSASSCDYLDSRSPALTSKSSGPFWSPVVTEAQSPSSATSIGTVPTQAAPAASSRMRNSTLAAGALDDVGRLRQRLTSLLTSDLGVSVFNDGSETDMAFWTGLGGLLTEQHLCATTKSLTTSGNERNMTNTTSTRKIGRHIDLDAAFAKMAKLFSASNDPFVKLSLLHDIDTLLPVWSGLHPDFSTTSNTSMQSQPQPAIDRSRPSADASVRGFRILFSNSAIRPNAIFRDLQYIAALVPSSLLESTAQGKAFWNAAVAISGLKHEARNVLVETADSIIAYHSNNRGHGRSSSLAQQERDSATFSTPSRTPPAEDVAQYTMADAAYLLQITAKEGDPVAQRELATLYLTHPELMDHIIAPFSSSKEVFKEELESKWRRNQDPNRCDPTTMCVAHHWMSLSSKGGDALAQEYLRQREEMERLP